MKRRVLAVLVALFMVIGGAGAAHARGGAGGGHAGSGGRGGGASFHGGGGGHFRGDGGHFRGGHFRGGHFHGHGGVFVGVGPAFWWDPFWAPAYAYGPPVVVEQPPAVYVERSYWYYCASAGAYYPYVRQCPEGWQRVVPQ